MAHTRNQPKARAKRGSSTKKQTRAKGKGSKGGPMTPRFTSTPSAQGGGY